MLPLQNRGLLWMSASLLPPIKNSRLPLLASIQLLDPCDLKYGCRFSLLQTSKVPPVTLCLASFSEPAPETSCILGICHPFHLRYKAMFWSR